IRRRSHARADAEPRPPRRGVTARRRGRPVGCGREPAAAVARAGGEDARHPWLWEDRSGAGPTRPRLRHEGLRDPARRDALEPGRALVPGRARRSRRGPATRGLSDCHALAQRRDAGPPGRARARAHEAHSRSGQRGARGDRRRGRALPGIGGAAARRCRARRVVSLSEGGGPHAARLPTVLRALQRADDTARVGVDRGYARGPCDGHRREHPADRARGAPAEPDSLTGLPLLALFIVRSSRPAGPQPRDGLRLALPFFYGWVIVVVGFVTMAVCVNARTALSPPFPRSLGHFG